MEFLTSHEYDHVLSVLIRPPTFLFVTQRYPKTKTNMFVIESKDQAAILSVRSVASISTLSFW
jgi:hypothetical protein